MDHSIYVVDKHDMFTAYPLVRDSLFWWLLCWLCHFFSVDLLVKISHVPSPLCGHVSEYIHHKKCPLVKGTANHTPPLWVSLKCIQQILRWIANPKLGVSWKTLKNCSKEYIGTIYFEMSLAFFPGSNCNESAVSTWLKSKASKVFIAKRLVVNQTRTADGVCFVCWKTIAS